MTTLKELAVYAARSDFDIEQGGGDWKQATDWFEFALSYYNETLTDAMWRQFKLSYQLERAQLAARKLRDSHPAFY